MRLRLIRFEPVEEARLGDRGGNQRDQQEGDDDAAAHQELSRLEPRWWTADRSAVAWLIVSFSGVQAFAEVVGEDAGLGLLAFGDLRHHATLVHDVDARGEVDQFRQFRGRDDDAASPSTSRFMKL